MKERYTTRTSHHPGLGPTVDVYDKETRRSIAPYSGPYAQERADQRARELNAENERASGEDDR